MVCVSPRLGRERCDPIWKEENGEILLSGRIHLGAVKTYPDSFPVSHRFLREGGAKGVLRQPFLPVRIVPSNI